MATDDKLTILYNWLEEMTKAGDAVKEKHEENYNTIIEYVKTSDTKERILAAQLISRFFKYFKDQEEAAFDAIVDLCESADVDVRKHATMAMITICRDCKHLVTKAADILIQLYQTNQASEVNLINRSLMTLLNLDTLKFLESFFTNFGDGAEIVRERALKFLSSHLQRVPENAFTKEVEEKLMDYTQKAMEDVTKDEFILFIGILSKLKLAKTVAGQAKIVNAIKAQVELDKEFKADDKDSLDKFLLCARHTIPFLSQYNRASEYINYLCLNILPNLKDPELTVLQTLAEMSPYVHSDDIPKLIDLEKCQQTVYDALLVYVPAPEPGKEIDYQFSHIEYLIYTFHQFGRLNPDFFNEERHNSIYKRLYSLAVGCQKYIDILNRVHDPKNEEIRKVALQTTKNIQIITSKDLLKKPPLFKTVVKLSINSSQENHSIKRFKSQ